VANSVNGLHKILTDPTLCGWHAERISVLTDPVDVRRLVQTLRRLAATTDDVLLVYFVGHGTILRRGQLCLVLSDTDAQDPDVTGLEFERIREALLDSPARTKIVILDCCYSGRAIEALGGAAVADSTDTRGVYTLSASDHTAHVPAPDRQAGAHTSFTGELLDLLRTGIPNGPEKLTLSLIYLHLRRRLETRQLPAPNQRGTDTVSQYPFTRNAAAPPVEPPPPPPDPIGPPPPPIPARGAATDQQRSTSPRARPPWQPARHGCTVVLGVLFLVIGSLPGKAVVAGLQLLIYGGYRVAQSSAAREPRPTRRVLLVVVGVGALATAVVVLSNADAGFTDPVRPSLSMFWFTGGAIEIVAATRGGPRRSRAQEIASGVLGVIAGGVLGIDIEPPPSALRWMQLITLGTWLIVVGIALVCAGLQHRRGLTI
jgi:uncharacterized membrane protein HdeD (DUF308 family)